MTNELRKAAEMALEALEMFCEHGAILRPLETKEALRQALAQPEKYLRFEGPIHVECQCDKCKAQPEQEPWVKTYCGGKPNYCTPENEPVAWANSSDLQNFDMRVRTNRDHYHTVPLYTVPPREWVGLTDEERRGIREWQEIQKELGPVWAPMMLYLYDAIEARLKEKNGG